MANLRVGVDISLMNPQSRARGIGIYAQNLVEAIKRYTDIDVELVEKKRKKNLDVIHYPYFDFFDLTLPFVKKAPSIVTVHDCIPLLFPEHYPPGIKGKIKSKIQEFMLLKQDAIITVSSASKQDIEELLLVPSEKIFVVRSAPPPAFKKIYEKAELEKVRRKYDLPEKFALFIGSVNWNKNLLNMAQACKETDMPLVLIGGAFKNRENLDHPELSSFKLFLQGFGDSPLIRMLGYVEENDLVSITNLAFVTLLPSFYEGFGFSILQSQMCGVPVITSNTSSMPEVAGEGAIFIDPNSINDISEALKNLADIELRKKLIKKGFENCAKFSWENTAKDTADIYKEVLAR